MRTSEVLNRAADLIEERGWTVGSGWIQRGQGNQHLCLEGGIMAAMGMEFPEVIIDAVYGPFAMCPAYQAVSAYLNREVAYLDGVVRGETLYGWNDRQDAAVEVIEVLRACAVIEAAKESDRETVEAAS